MRICILKESMCIGGTERSAANISKVLEQDHSVTVALYDGRDIQYPCGGTLVDFCLPPKKTKVGKVINTLLREIKIRKLLKDNDFDVLYTFTSINNRQTRYKYPNEIKIISARDFGKMRDQHLQYHKALQKADAMICNSEYIKQYYLSRYPKHRDKVFAVHNCLDLGQINNQAKEEVDFPFLLFVQAHKQTVVSVGRFCKEKGFEYLIEAFAQAREKNSNLGLVLVGDGEYKQKYEEIIERLGVKDHVFFTGYQQNPYKYVARCTCYVLSSISEGFPNVLAEAMALGLPVIADNCYSGPAEILRADSDYEAVTNQNVNCDFGILTPIITETDNSHAISRLSQAIEELLCDKDKMDVFKNASLKRAKDFSMEATREQLNSIFSELAERKRKA